MMDSSWVTDMVIEPKLSGGTEKQFAETFERWLKSKTPDYVPEYAKENYSDWKENFIHLVEIHSSNSKIYEDSLISLLEEKYIHDEDVYFFRDLAEFFDGYFELEIRDLDGMWKFRYIFENSAFLVAEEERVWGDNVDCDEFYGVEPLPIEEKLRRSI